MNTSQNTTTQYAVSTYDAGLSATDRVSDPDEVGHIVTRHETLAEARKALPRMSTNFALTAIDADGVRRWLNAEEADSSDVIAIRANIFLGGATNTYHDCYFFIPVTSTTTATPTTELSYQPTATQQRKKSIHIKLRYRALKDAVTDERQNGPTLQFFSTDN